MTGKTKLDLEKIRKKIQLEKLEWKKDQDMEHRWSMFIGKVMLLIAEVWLAIISLFTIFKILFPRIA